MTECTQTSFEFVGPGGRQVVAQFDGGRMSSDAGGLLLRSVNEKMRLMSRLVGCFRDDRDPDKIEHPLERLLSQRVYGLALGYEDLNDHDLLRVDPTLALLSQCPDITGADRVRERDKGKPLAGKSTLNRLEQSVRESGRYHKINYDAGKIDQLLVDLFVGSFGEVPEEIVLDMDATDLPLHGSQENRFFHGYYGGYCYLPLYIFCGEHLLCARLRRSNIDGSKGAGWELRRLVRQIRTRWAGVRIMVRGDSGFCRERLMRWCERHQVEYVFGLARNPRLQRELAEAMKQAQQESESTGKAARIYREFEYQTLETWSRARRVVGKAEYLGDKANPRFVVTSLGAEEWPAGKLYEEGYCPRGEMENRIKEQMGLFCDRVSTATMRANQLRLYLSAMAYVLVSGLRRLGLKGTELAQAQVETIRRKLFKIGAQVRVTVRKVWVSMASGYAYQGLFGRIWAALAAGGL